MEPQIRRKVTKLRVQAFREAVAYKGNRCVLTPTFYGRQSAELSWLCFACCAARVMVALLGLDSIAEAPTAFSAHPD
jgi:hypothetical protein